MSVDVPAMSSRLVTEMGPNNGARALSEIGGTSTFRVTWDPRLKIVKLYDMQPAEAGDTGRGS